MTITLKDFQPFNNGWKEDSSKNFYNGSSLYIIDEPTGRKYLNESTTCVQIKCGLLIIGTPFLHIIPVIANIAYRTLKIVSLSHFYTKKEQELEYNFKARCIDAGSDLARLIATPFSIPALELAAIYGLFRPYDGRKLYASTERAIYGEAISAPCFQPTPTYHLLGGDIKTQNAY